MTKSEENWYANYEELKARVIETGHFFPKHSGKNGADCYSKNGHAVTDLTRQS